MKLWLNSVPAI